MNPELWQALLVVAIPPTIAAIASLIVSWMNRQKLQDMHVLVNSRLSELVDANARANRAEGVVQGTSDSATLTKMVQDAVAEALKVVPVVTDVPVVVTPIPPEEPPLKPKRSPA